MIVDIDNVTPNGKVLYYIVCTDDALSFDMDQMYACVRARLCMYVCLCSCVCVQACIHLEAKNNTEYEFTAFQYLAD